MVVASIDLSRGKAVQMQQGVRPVLERDNPLELAETFSRYGETAVIDLDAALGKGDNLALIRQICARGDCRVGGGIRTVAAAQKIVSWGAVKVIIGTKAFNGDKINRPFLEKLSRAVGKKRVVIALDFKGKEVVTQGWRHTTGVTLERALAWFAPYAGEFLLTAVDYEGLMNGTDWQTLEWVANHTTVPITFAGGIASLAGIHRCAALGVDVQLGMALYTGKIGLADAFVHSLKWRDVLIPVVTTDREGQVLMLAYGNRESIKRSFETQKMWYFSRSRQRLWQKGESSGNIQHLIYLRADCDRDAILAVVNQQGPACHLGQYTCFGGRDFSLRQLYDVVRERITQPGHISYTASLSDSKLREKLMEEAGEVVEARGRDEVVWEAADLLYFLTVLMAKEGIEYGDVIAELWRRRCEKGSVPVDTA